MKTGEEVLEAKFISRTNVRGVWKHRWECPNCKANKEPESRFNLNPQQENKTHKCRFCKTELIITKGETKMEENNDDLIEAEKVKEEQKIMEEAQSQEEPTEEKVKEALDELNDVVTPVRFTEEEAKLEEKRVGEAQLKKAHSEFKPEEHFQPEQPIKTLVTVVQDSDYTKHLNALRDNETGVFVNGLGIGRIIEVKNDFITFKISKENEITKKKKVDSKTTNYTEKELITEVVHIQINKIDTISEAEKKVPKTETNQKIDDDLGGL